MTNRAAQASLNPQLLYVLDANGNPVPATLDQLDGGALSETVGQLVDGGGRRFAVGATTQRVELPPLGASRRVRLLASSRQFFRFGGSTVSASVAETSTPIPADAAEYFIVPAGATHIASIRDSVDGFLHIAPVAG